MAFLKNDSIFTLALKREAAKLTLLSPSINARNDDAQIGEYRLQTQ